MSSQRVEVLRDFGHFNITRRDAEKQARYAARLHEDAGLGSPIAWVYRSEWAPWDECAAAFAAARERAEITAE